MAPGSTSIVDKPRAWVIRLPGVFVGYDGSRQKGSFQTIVMAPTADYAWDVAIQQDVWEPLPFQVSNVQIFPKDPEVAINGNHQTH